MDTNDASVKLPWETPVAIALTDADGRADQRDVALQNGVDGEPGISGGP